MTKKTLILFAILWRISNFATAQDIDYHKVSFTHMLPATTILDAQIKTFDYQVMFSNNLEENTDANKMETIKNGLAKNLTLSLGKLQKVETGGDLHIIALIHSFRAVAYAKSTIGTGFSLTTSVNYNTNIYTKTGVLIYSNNYGNEALVTSFSENWNAADVKTNDIYIRNKISSNVIMASLEALNKELNGGAIKIETELADLDGVKKFPELKVMEDQRKALDKALSSGGPAAYVQAAVAYVPFWESNKTFNASKDSNDVRRAVFQNLALYYIFNNESNKANEILELYKPIDKNIKAFFGLANYKNSERLSGIASKFNYEIKNINIESNEKTFTALEMVDKQRYETIDGTITIDERKISGTYKGKIKIFKGEQGDAATSGIVSLDGDNPRVIIVVKENGVDKFINTNISKITNFVGDDGKKYLVSKISVPLLGSSYSLLKEIFGSPKITAFKNPLALDSKEWVIKKAGDEKGVKLTLFNAKKNLIEYLSTCEAAVSFIKETKNIGTIDVEKLGSLFTACN